MEYITIFLISSGIVVYIIVSSWVAKSFSKKPFECWLGFQLAIGTASAVAVGIYQTYGINGFITITTAFAGVLTPLVIWYGLYKLVKGGKALRATKLTLVKELPERGEYIDVEYAKPTHRTVAELIES